MPALRALLRLAWRDARRHRGRSLLVMALVGVPVAGLVGCGSLLTVLNQVPTAEYYIAAPTS